MKKFQFTLQKLLEYKEMLHNDAKNSLAALQAHKIKILQKIESLESQISDIQQKLKIKAEQGTTISEIQGFAFQIEQGKQEVKALNHELEQIEIAIQKQLQVVIKLSQETAELEKLKERQWEEYQIELRKAEELIISEYLSTKIAAGQAV